MPPYANQTYYDEVVNYPLIDQNYIDRELRKYSKFEFNKNSVDKYLQNYNSKNNSNSIVSYRGTYNQRFLAKKITKDGLYYIFDSSKKPTFDKNYAKSTVKEYSSGLTLRYVFKTTTKLGGKALTGAVRTGKTVMDTSVCIINEENFLKSNGIFDMENLGKAHIKCAVNSGVKQYNYELGLVGNIAGIGASTLTDIAIENSYKPHGERGKLSSFFNNTALFSYNYLEKPILKGIEYVAEPVNNTLDFVGESVVNVGNYLFDKTKFIFENKSSENTLLDYDSNSNIYGNKSTSNITYYDIYSPDSDLDLFYYESQKNNSFDDNVSVGPEIQEESFIQESYLNNVVDEITKNLNLSNETNHITLKDKLQLFSDKLTPKLGKLSQFITVCNLIKNFKNMSDISKITEIECFLISLKTDDKFVNGIFRFYADIATQGKIKFNNVLNLAVSAAEKYLGVPLKNAYNFVKALVDGESVKKYLMPVLTDVVSLIVPSAGLINMMTGIIKGIESLFSHQKIKNISGIDAMCTDQLKIGFFKIRHKVTYENAFFGIKITHTSRHASDSKKYCEEEFKKELDHKVYQVLGIPVEFINDTYVKPVTRYENYAMKFYLEDLEKKWLDINDKYLTENDKKLIESMYFESDEDKKYRYSLAQKGEAPSWFWNNKRNNIITFIEDVWDIISEDFKKTVKINDLNLLSFNGLNKLFDRVCKYITTTYHHIFDNNSMIPVSDLETQENDSRNKAFEDARDKRNKNDNRSLDSFRDSQRNYYNSLVGPYTREEIIKRACLELWDKQQTLEYLMNSGYSTFIGFMGSSVAYLDYEVQKFINNPLKYPFGKLNDYTKSFTQGYLTGILVDQACLWTSLLEITEELSDDYLVNYINPFIASGVGIGVGIMRYLVTFDKRKEKNKFKYVVYNGVTSTVNSSFGVIFSYLKKTATFSSLKTTMWSDFVAITTKALNTIFKVGMTVDFVSAVAAATAFNLGMRILSKIYSVLNSTPEGFAIEEPRGDVNIKQIMYKGEIEKNTPLPKIVNLKYTIKEHQSEVQADFNHNPIINNTKHKKKLTKFRMKTNEFKKNSLSRGINKQSFLSSKLKSY